MKSESEAVRIMLLFVTTVFAVSACGSTKLLDIDKTAKKLNFTQAQLEIAQPKIEQIDKIVEDYDLAKKTLESEMTEMSEGMRGGRGFDGGGGGRHGGGMRGGFQNKMQALNQQRTASRQQIDTLVVEIQKVLDEEQLQAFADIALPELKAPDIGGGFGGRGGGRRRGGGVGRF